MGGMYTASRFALIVGLLLLVEGVWGLFSFNVFGALTTNPAHAVIHIALGIAALGAWRSGHACGYSTFLGILLLVVGGLWFMPGTQSVIVQFLNVNLAGAWVNIAVGLVALLCARIAHRSYVTEL
jgi:hypothetical protein